MIEPKARNFSSAVSLEMISDFANNFTKSLKAYSKYQFKQTFRNATHDAEELEVNAEKFQEEVEPVLTTAAFGSFRFSVASDFLLRVGENEEVAALKAAVVQQYHETIFTRDMDSEFILEIKQNLSDEEIDHIFRPIFNIRSEKSEYRVSYYDKDTFRRKVLKRTVNADKNKLLPVKQINADDIGKLETTLSHIRKLNQGSGLSRSIILKQELKAYSFDYTTSILEPKNQPAIILNQEIRINIGFNSEVGFTFSFDDLPIEVTSLNYEDGLDKFYLQFISFITNLAAKEIHDEAESKYWLTITKLVANPDAV